MAAPEQQQEEERVFAKCAKRLIPFIMLLYVTNYLDRVNVGFAALTMNKDLGFSARSMASPPASFRQLCHLQIADDAGRNPRRLRHHDAWGRCHRHA